MNKIHPSPHVKFAYTVTGSDMQGLFCAIKQTTGLDYGYMVDKMIDTQILSATLTLCKNGSKNIPWKKLAHVQTAIEAWAIGRGLGNARVKWNTI